MTTLHELLLESARKWPDNVAVITDDGDPKTERRVSYSELGRRIKKICDVLVKHGVECEVVGVALLPTEHTPAVLAGVMSVPAAYLPIDVDGPNKVLQTTLSRVGVRVILASPGLLKNLLDKLQPHEPVLTHVDSMDLFLIHLTVIKGCKWQSPLAYVITTSGSTGLPMIVRVPHSCIIPNIQHLSEIYGLGPKDVVLQASPLTFDPSVVEIFTTLSCGASLVIVPESLKQVPQTLVEVLIRQRVSLLQATPSLISNIGRPVLSSRLLCGSSHLRMLVLGGETCPSPQVLNMWRSADNTTSLLNIYGITEVSSWAMYHQITGNDLSSGKEIPLGKVLKGTMVEVRDDEGQKVNQGEGFLFIGGPERVCIIKDESAPPDDVMRPSGDRVLVDGAGVVWYRGRADRQVKRHGKRMNLDELEQVASQCDGVGQSVALLSEDDRLYLFVVPATAARGNTEIHVRLTSHLKEDLAVQYQPDHVLLLPALPITKHGKVDHRYLYQLNPGVEGERCTPAGDHRDLVKSLQLLWNESLHVPASQPVGANNTFLTSGGNSFTAVRLLNLITHHFGTKIPQLLETLLSGTFADVITMVTVCHERAVGKFHTQNEGTPLSECPDDLKKRIPNVDLKRNITTDLADDLEGQASADNSSSSKKLKLEDEITKEPDCKSSKELQPDAKHYHGPLLRNKGQGRNHHANCCFSVSRGNKRTLLCVSQEVALGPCPMVSKMECPVMEYNTRAQHSLLDTQAGEWEREEERGDTPVNFEEIWRQDTGKCVDASPLIVTDSNGSMVFVGSHSHRFTAICLYTGRRAWEQVLGDRVESSACLAPSGEHVVVGCYDHRVYVLDRHNGTIMWTFPTRGQVKSSPVADIMTGLVYIGSHDQHLYGLDVKRQRKVWKCCLGGGVFSSACVSSEPHLVYAASLAGTLAALDPVSGSVVWRQDVANPIFASPCVTPEGVCVGCVDGRLHHFSHSGVQMWTFKTSGAVFSSPCLHRWRSTTRPIRHTSGQQTHITTEYSLVFGCHDNSIYCVNCQGELKWSFKVDCPVYATPFLHTCLRDGTDTYSERKGLVIVCTTRGRLCALDAHSGGLLCEVALPGDVFSSPVIADNSVVIGCRNNYIYRFRFKR